MDDFAMFQAMVNNQNQEDGVVAEFYDKAIKTEEFNAKGLPVFQTITYVRIRLKDNYDVFDQPATNEHKRRFPVEYNRYLLGKKEEENGTPLTQFAFLNAQQLEACKHYGVFTVERLAELSDEQTASLDLAAERDAAQRFLTISKNNLAIANFAKKEKALKAEIKKLEEQIKELQALLQQKQGA